MKITLLTFMFLTGLVSAQSNYLLLIDGTRENAVMNPIYSPDGNKVAYTKSGYQGIWIYNLSTQSSKQITDEPAAGFGFKWSSDSQSILCRVAKYEDTKRFNAVKIFDVNTDYSLQLTDYRTMMPYLPDWSNADSKIILPIKEGVEVYSSGKSNKSVSHTSEINVYTKYDKIVARNIDTEIEKILEPIKNAEIINLITSPDKNKIAFEVMGGNMYSMNADGTNLTDLGKGNRPGWSSDSKKIIYMITADDGHEFTASDIYIVNADGTQKINLTNTNDIMEMNPSLSPDGKAFVFDAYNDGSIYLMNID